MITYLVNTSHATTQSVLASRLHIWYKTLHSPQNKPRGGAVDSGKAGKGSVLVPLSGWFRLQISELSAATSDLTMIQGSQDP